MSTILSSPSGRTFMALRSMRTTSSVAVCFLLSILVLVFLTALGNAQTKPERQSKSAKPAQAAQPAQPAAKSDDAESADSSKPEDKVFKGMKYRLIGPFRGGRS